MSRDYVLHKIRTALGRSAGQTPSPPPPVRLRIPDVGIEERVQSFITRVEALAGKGIRVASPQEAGLYVQATVAGAPAVASNAPFLGECGITDLPNVRSGIAGRAELRELCATAAFGITSADYALADTGTLVS